MDTHCVSCKKNTGINISSVKRTEQTRLMLISSCAVCGLLDRGLLEIKKKVDYNSGKNCFNKRNETKC